MPFRPVLDDNGNPTRDFFLEYNLTDKEYRWRFKGSTSPRMVKFIAENYSQGGGDSLKDHHKKQLRAVLNAGGDINPADILSDNGLDVHLAKIERATTDTSIEAIKDAEEAIDAIYQEAEKAVDQNVKHFEDAVLALKSVITLVDEPPKNSNGEPISAFDLLVDSVLAEVFAELIAFFFGSPSTTIK